jgi:hypothetical protein
MATTTDPVAGVQMIPLSEIRHDQNVRQELVADEVDALAQSIALLGQLTPVSVRPDNEDGGYVLYLQEAVIRSRAARESVSCRKVGGRDGGGLRIIPAAADRASRHGGRLAWEVLDGKASEAGVGSVGVIGLAVSVVVGRAGVHAGDDHGRDLSSGWVESLPGAASSWRSAS